MIIGIQICSGQEWRATQKIKHISPGDLEHYPYGEFFRNSVESHEAVFFHSHCTKTRAAGACQYAIDHWKVDPIVVLGTCGGVASRLKTLDIILATRTIQWDCVEVLRGRSDKISPKGITDLDLSWLGDLGGIEHHRGILATGDQDVTFRNLKWLRELNSLGADWESGAIAKICSLNKIRCAVLRGVSDIPMGPIIGGSKASPWGRNLSVGGPKYMNSKLNLKGTGVTLKEGF